MYLTNRDRDILKFVEEYKSITINQCAKIFFYKSKENNAYYQSRKRLKLLSDNNFLKRYRKDMRSQTVYYLTKKLSLHNLKILDVYAELINIGAKIKYFKTEYIIPTKTKDYRADGLIEFTYKNYWYSLLIEIDYTHFTSTKKLLDIYNSNYFQDKYKNLDDEIFPTILIIKPFVSNAATSHLPFNIVYTTMYNININKIFM